jgi:hypothetical protein
MPKVQQPVSFRLPPSVLAVMRRLAAQRECSLAQVLRDAVATEALLDGWQEEGGTILLRDPDGTTKALVFTH